MNLLLICLVGALLIAATVLIHYEALRVTGKFARRLPIRPRQRILVVISGCLMVHMMEVGLYAATFAALHSWSHLGVIEGAFDASALDFLYFSFTNYTTLGIGDVFPHGPLRLLAGIEALNGFVLITWSASFAYLMMQRHWHPEQDD